MNHTASGLTTSESDQSGASLPGLVAAAIWAVGLMAGLVALATGHAAVAAVCLVLAAMSPWLGLAWVSHSQRRVAEPALSWVGIDSDEPLPTRLPGLRFTAR